MAGSHTTTWAVIVTVAFLAPASLGQTTSSVDSAALSAAGVSTTSTASTQPVTFWSLVAQIPAACKKCKAKCCASCCGQMINEMTKPLSLMTGGCIQCCPDGPAHQDPKAAGPVGAAASLAQCIESAPERIAAVRYMATADCGRFPEVEQSMIQALRGDCSECVRYEAALAFNMGCCCTEKTIKALQECVTGGTRDGFPRETSLRVRQAAMAALQRCEMTYQPEDPIRPEEPVPPETPDSGPQPAQPLTPITPPEVPASPSSSAGAAPPVGVSISDEDRRLLANTLSNELRPVAVEGKTPRPERSLFHVVARARRGPADVHVESSQSRGLLRRFWAR